MSARAVTLLMLVAALGLAAPSPAPAQDHDGHAAVLTLDPAGARWATDAPLRQGMEAMRAAAVGAPASELADVVDAQVAYIIENCSLPPEADANLHLVIEHLIEAAEALRLDDGARGRTEVIAALNAYGAHFNHPGWRALTS